MLALGVNRCQPVSTQGFNQLQIQSRGAATCVNTNAGSSKPTFGAADQDTTDKSAKCVCCRNLIQRLRIMLSRFWRRMKGSVVEAWEVRTPAI